MAPLHRPARADDYPAFARLFRELGVDDPTPSPETFLEDMAPSTWIFEQDGEVAGYLYFQRLADTGYVRHLALDPAARGRGHGRALLLALADHFRAAGCARWCLNVKPDNLPALRLYTGLGMREAYRAHALRFPWTLVDALPASELALGTCPIDPAEEAAIERAFGVPAGQLADTRARGGRVPLRLRDPAAPDDLGLGFAMFAPNFPGAFPFRVAAPRHARALLQGMRTHARPDLPAVQIVAEGDPGLVALLQSHGAALALEICHLAGPLPDPT